MWLWVQRLTISYVYHLSSSEEPRSRTRITRSSGGMMERTVVWELFGPPLSSSDEGLSIDHLPDFGLIVGELIDLPRPVPV